MVEPHYRTESVNAPVTLATGPISLRQGERSETAPDGSVKFAWLPLPGVVVTGPWPRIHQPTVEVAGIGVSIDGTFVIDRAGTFGIRAVSDGDVYIRRTESKAPRLACADLHILNLPHVAGSAVREGTSTIPGRQSWRFGRWSMTMDPIFTPSQVIAEAKDVRGNVLTHVVRVSLADCSSFGTDELRQVVDDLHLALSFLFGDDIGPVLAAGRDERGEVVLELLRPYPCDGWRPRWGPAPRYSGIAPMMESLGTILDKPDDGLRDAVVYHVESCFGMVEATVLLSQASLDRLADHCLVATRRIVTEKQYDRRSTAQNLRHAMQVLGIPTTLDGREMDLPDLITNSRNRVHVRARAKPVEAVDVYEHALQTAELVMLALAGYSGLYHPRGSRHATDELMVPWVSQVV